MFGAAVNEVESNQAERDDKGESTDEKKEASKKESKPEAQSLEQNGEELDTSEFD